MSKEFVLYIKNKIQDIVIYINKNKKLGLISMNAVNSTIKQLEDINDNIKDEPNVVFDKMSNIIKNTGIKNLNDLLKIHYKNIGYTLSLIEDEDKELYKLLELYFHPLNYSVEIISKPINVLSVKKNTSNKTDIKLIKCKDIDILNNELENNFNLRIFGITLSLYCSQTNSYLKINGFMDDINIKLLDNQFIKKNLKELEQLNLKLENSNTNKPELKGSPYNITEFIESVNIKDICINKTTEVQYLETISILNNTKLKELSKNVKEFSLLQLYEKRNFLLKLLTFKKDQENHYLSYLLYDLLSSDANSGLIDTIDQDTIVDSFTPAIKDKFKDSLKNTSNYLNKLSSFDINKVPLEQQICSMKVPDSVKEKAMIKLKEVKTKSDDSILKARQYLDGLLKIPFGIFKKEKILTIMNLIKTDFLLICQSNNTIPKSDNYSNIEILKYIKTKYEFYYNNLKQNIPTYNKAILLQFVSKITIFIASTNISYKNINISAKKQDLVNYIIEFIDFIKINHKLSHNIFSLTMDEVSKNEFAKIKNISNNFELINNYMKDVRNILDKSVYGHGKAKNQLERIVAQWINGKPTGYCFGFEGPMGSGKTTLAKKGLAYCLKDDNGNTRPFSIIQIGGDSNGSTLHGHNYTYVGSSWGSIVQILMDKKIMNPIILIDEVDKISKTENGKELIGILIHMLDSTQNECFQDKYFSGVEIDLSKVLFILSYNNPELIDKILLDRIHRIKFEALNIDEKIIISKQYLLPEIYENMGLTGNIIIGDDVIKHVIENFTCENGVRKLKELLFEIVGELNLNILKNIYEAETIPIIISIEDIDRYYLKENIQIHNKKIHQQPIVGVMNGLYASGYGGGILPISIKHYPSSTFLELKMTGSLGDTIKESINVAFTVAWNLTSLAQQEIIIKKCKTDRIQGLHIHAGEGATPKNGPSAGGCLTVVIFSLLNNLEIPNDLAMTGEIDLNGFITEIGGLNLKILGAIKANIKTIIFPKENIKDYDIFIEKYKEMKELKDITFYPVENINEVIKIIFK